MINLLPHAGSYQEPDVSDELRPLADTLIELESKHHEAGWDSVPVMLYMLSEPENGEMHLAVTGARLGVHTHPREEIMRVAASMQVLAEIAKSDYDLGEERRNKLLDVYGTYPLGHAIVMESWVAIPGETTTDMEALENRSMADIPGSLEARFAFLASEHGLLIVCRVRDQEPEFGCYEESGSVSFGGVMLDSLIVYDEMARELSKSLKEVTA